MSNLKIFSPSDLSIEEWQDPDLPIWRTTTSFDEFYKQDFRIVLINPFFDQTNNTLSNIDISTVDLFLFSENIQDNTLQILKWIREKNIHNFLLLQEHTNYINDDIIYRLYWLINQPCMNFYDKEQIENLRNPVHKKFKFECLLGTPKLHRSFLMCSLLKEKSLLEKSLVSYRKDFLDFTDINEYLDYLLKYPAMSKFEDILKNHIPYSSSAIDNYDKSFNVNLARKGEIFPLEFFKVTWYSIITETGFEALTITEKIGRAFFAKRIFIVFGAPFVIQQLHNLGFKTFNHIIDEGYDLVADDFKRWHLAFEQIKQLDNLIPEEVYKLSEEILEHNYNRLNELKKECRKEAHARLSSRIPKECLNII